MKFEKLYWIVVSVFGVIHLHKVLLNLSFVVPIFISIGLVIIAIYFVHKKVIISIFAIGVRWHILLFGLQILTICFYLFIEPTWLYLIPLIQFIIIEIIRIQLSNRMEKLTRDIQTIISEREQMNETFRVVRSERHDFLKHISALHYMLESSHESELKSYLDQLVDGYEETNLSIKGERGTVAAILQQMYKKAKKLGIEVIYGLDIPISSLPLSDQELTSLLGNLLSNSIESCEEWQPKRGKQALITVQFYKRSGLYILICENNSLPIPNTILDNLFVTYGKTTKSGEHEGLGTKIIDDMVKHHQGFLDFTYKKEQFSIKIKIPAVK